jgi:hypothetical protein
MYLKIGKSSYKMGQVKKVKRVLYFGTEVVFGRLSAKRQTIIFSGSMLRVQLGEKYLKDSQLIDLVSFADIFVTKIPYLFKFLLIHLIG